MGITSSLRRRGGTFKNVAIPGTWAFFLLSENYFFASSGLFKLQSVCGSFWSSCGSRSIPQKVKERTFVRSQGVNLSELYMFMNISPRAIMPVAMYSLLERTSLNTMTLTTFTARITPALKHGYTR